MADGPRHESGDPPALPDQERGSPSAAGPPGRGVFSLEDRPAPGLYFTAWLLSGLGLALLFVGAQAGPDVAAILAVGSLLLLAPGLAAAAGYQVLARRRRPSTAYRGPSPVLVFALYFVAINLVLGVLMLVGIVQAGIPTGVFQAIAVQVVGYLLVVWLFVIRTGALPWAALDLDRAQRPTRLIGDGLIAAAVMIPTTFIAVVLTSLLATLLGTTPPYPLPSARTELELVLLALAFIVLVPIGEEVFFRGYALTAWLRDLGERSAMLRSVAFFALIHVINVNATTFDEGLRQALLVVVLVAPIAAVLGFIFLRYGLLAAIVAHATYNGIGFIGNVFRDTLPPPT